MRHHLSHNTYIHERDMALMAAYRRLISESEYIYTPDFYQRLASLPTRRFFVSEERATAVISLMHRGGTLDNMLPLRKAMYEEIYRRTISLLAQRPELSLSDAVWLVIDTPAPCFYLTPESAQTIICRIRRRQKDAIPTGRSDTRLDDNLTIRGNSIS